MGRIEDLWRYDGRRVVVSGCASGIGAHVARQLSELGAEVIGLDVREPEPVVGSFYEADLASAASIGRAASAIGGRVDALFNVAGVSSGIGDPQRVVTINFLGLRQLTDALVGSMPGGSSIVSVSSLAAAGYLDHLDTVAGLLGTGSFDEGIDWCRRHPDALADGGYRLSKEAVILYTMKNAVSLGRRGIRINCTGPGVTETPILEQLRDVYGQRYLDDIAKPLGRAAEPAEQAAVLVFLNSRAASYISGEVVWVDGGNLASRVAHRLAERQSWPA